MATELWLDNPRHRRRHHKKRHRRHRRNPALAEYLFGNPRRRHRTRGRHRRHRRHGYRHNPPVVGMGVLRRPMPFLMEGLSGAAGIYTTITVGNMLRGFLPVTWHGDDLTSRIAKYATRGVAAWGIDTFGGRFLGASNRHAFRVGAVIGLVGGIIFDFLARPLLIGPGDIAMTGPGYAFGMAGYTQMQLPGTSLQGYIQTRLPGTALGRQYVDGRLGAGALVQSGLDAQNSWGVR